MLALGSLEGLGDRVRSLIAVGTALPLGRLDDEDAVVANQTHHTQDLNCSATNAVTRTAGVQLSKQQPPMAKRK